MNKIEIYRNTQNNDNDNHVHGKQKNKNKSHLQCKRERESMYKRNTEQIMSKHSEKSNKYIVKLAAGTKSHTQTASPYRNVIVNTHPNQMKLLNIATI